MIGHHQSSVTWDELKGLQKLKEAKRDPPLGHQRQSSPADTLFQIADLQNCERTGFCCFKLPGYFVGRIKGAKCPFDLQFLTWDFS